MRLVFQIFIGLLVLAGLSGVAWVHHRDLQHQRDRDNVQRELHRFQQQIALQAALLFQEDSNETYPKTIDPMWFDGDLPRHVLLSDEHPWLEVASEHQSHLDHPPQRVATHRSLAKFWYNPYKGVLRARVPTAISDQEALEMYNHINSSSLKDIFEPPAKPQVQPEPPKKNQRRSRR